MKKSILSLASFAIVFSMLFSSCTDNCQDENTQSASNQTMKPSFMDTVDPNEWVIAKCGGIPAAGADTTMYAKRALLKRPLLKANATESFTWTGLGYDILCGAGGMLKDYAKGKAKSALTDFVNGLIFGKSTDPKMVKLNEILQNLDNIQKQLDGMQTTMNEVQKKIDEQAFNDFRRDLDEILNMEYEYRNHTLRYYLQLEKATDEDEQRRIITEWATTNVSGNQTCEQGFNFLNKFVQFKRKYLAHDLTVFDLYDLVAFDNFAWESEGYDAREQFRATTAADVTLGMTMSYMYFCLNSENEYADKCVTAIEKVKEYYDANQLKKSKRAVCQIEGAYLTFDRENFWMEHQGMDFASSTWCNSDKSLFNPYNDHIASDSEIAEIKKSQLTESEFGILLSYYKTKYKKLTLIEALEKEQGIKIPESLVPQYTFYTYYGTEYSNLVTDNKILLQESKVVMWDAGYYSSVCSNRFRIENMRNACNPMGVWGLQPGTLNFSLAEMVAESEGNWGVNNEGITDKKDKYTAKEVGYMGNRDTDMPHYSQWKVKWFHMPAKTMLVKKGALKRYSDFWEAQNN